MSKRIGTKRFFSELQRNLKDSENRRLQHLSVDDLVELFDELVKLLGYFLSQGAIVIFRNHFSFYTNPVKRRCYTNGKKGYQLSFKRRVRLRPYPSFRNKTEIDITEEEYEEFLKNKKK